jgi:chaperonin cofactor prefoldin
MEKITQEKSVSEIYCNEFTLIQTSTAPLKELHCKDYTNPLYIDTSYEFGIWIEEWKAMNNQGDLLMKITDDKPCGNIRKDPYDPSKASRYLQLQPVSPSDVPKEKQELHSTIQDHPDTSEEFSMLNTDGHLYYYFSDMLGVEESEIKEELEWDNFTVDLQWDNI